VQILLMGVTLVVVYHVGKRLFNAQVGFVAGILLLFHPYLLGFTNQYASENLFIPLFLGGIGAWYWCRKSPSALRAIIFSFIWAAAGLTRMVGVYFALFSLSALFISTPKFRKHVFLCLGVFGLLWGGWAYRNLAVMGEARLFPTKIGYNLWLGNNRFYLDQLLYKRAELRQNVYFAPPENAPVLRQKYGLSDTEIEKLKRYDYPPEVVDSSEVAIDRALYRRFKLFVKENPQIVIVYYLERCLTSFSDSIAGLGDFRFYSLRSLYFLFLFALGFAGFIAAIKRFGRYWFLLSITVLYVLTVGTMTGFRFRLPLDPILALYAAMILWYFYGFITKKPSISTFAIP
jgi:hypothetical protein